MNINAPILAGHSIGGIVLGSHVEPVLTKLYEKQQEVELTLYDNPGVLLHSYKISSGVITINSNEQGLILSISCKPPYQGKYENKLWPGMSVARIKAVTHKQLLTCSALVLDGELGVFFSLPPPYDEYDYIRELPDDLVLDTIYVMDRLWRGY